MLVDTIFRRGRIHTLDDARPTASAMAVLAGRIVAVERGIALPGSSDRPVVNGAPLLGIHDMVNQRTASGEPFSPAEALTPAQALAAYTKGSAFASFEEHRKRTLAPGMLADFVMLGNDLGTVERDGIGETPVLATIVGGEILHDLVGLTQVDSGGRS